MQHILVCDDEEDIVAALKIYLEADGYCVHAAYTGADALKIVREDPRCCAQASLVQSWRSRARS